MMAAPGAPVVEPKMQVVERQKPQVVAQLQFGMFTGLDMCRVSHLKVTSKVIVTARLCSIPF
jgi:hypothetical protein